MMGIRVFRTLSGEVVCDHRPFDFGPVSDAAGRIHALNGPGRFDGRGK
jgi:hypothetical protein